MIIGYSAMLLVAAVGVFVILSAIERLSRKLSSVLWELHEITAKEKRGRK